MHLLRFACFVVVLIATACDNPPPAPSYCGDGFCRPAEAESCSTCPRDCGECGGADSGPGGFCGDGRCSGADGETCDTCSGDCGACPVTVTYVLSTADIPEVNADNEAPGFDLDGAPGTAFDSRCDDAINWTSPVTGARNVDNQLSANVIGLLAGMLDGGVRGAVEEQVASGAYLLLFEVSDVNDFTNDPSVGVRVLLGRLPVGTSRAGVGSDGRIVPGQSFEERRMLASIAGAEIAGGRLRVLVESLPIPGFVGLSENELPLQESVVAFAIAESALSNGEIGGLLFVTDVVAAAAASGTGIDESTIRGLYQPDLGPNADGSVCSGISAGLTFEAVRAELL